MKCTIIIGRKHEDYWDSKNKGKLVFSGNFDSTNLRLDSVKVAKEIAKLAKIDCYRVMRLDDSYGGYRYSEPALYETPDITEFFQKEKKEAEEYNALQNRRVKAINKLPKKKLVRGHGIPGVKIYVTRSDYTYHKSYSSSIQGYVGMFAEKNGQTKDNLGISSYKTRDGKFKRKKFKDDFEWNFMTPLSTMPTSFDYRELLETLIKARNEFNHKIKTVK